MAIDSTHLRKAYAKWIFRIVVKISGIVLVDLVEQVA